MRKIVYPYEYMDEWKKCNETLLPEKEEFYSDLNMVDITDADYTHANRVYEDFEIKKLSKYHDLYLKDDILLLADVFRKFYKKMCFKIYHLDPAKFISSIGLVWTVALKKTKVELELLTDIDKLLMLEKVYEKDYITQYIDMQKLMINI